MLPRQGERHDVPFAAIATAGHSVPNYQLLALMESYLGSGFVFLELYRTRRMMTRMPHGESRKVFLVVAGGNSSSQKHFEDTIQRKRTLQEVRGFLPSQEIENLEKIYHGSNFIVWRAVPGPMNESRGEKMAPGDVVLIYNTKSLASQNASLEPFSESFAGLS